MWFLLGAHSEHLSGLANSRPHYAAISEKFRIHHPSCRSELTKHVHMEPKPYHRAVSCVSGSGRVLTRMTMQKQGDPRAFLFRYLHHQRTLFLLSSPVALFDSWFFFFLPGVSCV